MAAEALKVLLVLVCNCLPMLVVLFVSRLLLVQRTDLVDSWSTAVKLASPDKPTTARIEQTKVNFAINFLSLSYFRS